MIGFEVFRKKEDDKPEEKKPFITRLNDNRLVKINPKMGGFFDLVLTFQTGHMNIKMFKVAVEEVKKANLSIFYKPIYDPSFILEGQGLFIEGNHPLVNATYNTWLKMINEMKAIEGRKWKMATEYQYYCFLVWLINKLVDEGKSVSDAIHSVVVDSTTLGNYYQSENSKLGFEPTGSRCVCGVYDLANTYKMLDCSNSERNIFWIAGGSYGDVGIIHPLADLNDYSKSDYADRIMPRSVPMLVL